MTNTLFQKGWNFYIQCQVAIYQYRKYFKRMEKRQSCITLSQQQKTKKFVNNLDLLVGHDDKYIYGRTETQKIINMVDDFPIVDDEGNRFTIFSNVDKFKKFSPGVYLLFRLLKHLIFMLCCMSLISFVQILMLLKSPYYKNFPDVVRMNLLRFTIASLEPQDYWIYIILDLANLLIFVGFMFWWSQKLRSKAKDCNEHEKLPSYLTVQLRRIPQDFSEENLENYLRDIEGITPHEIYTGRNYGEFLKYYTKLTDSAIELRILRQLYEHQDQIQGKKQQARPLIKKFLKLKDQFSSIKSQKFNQLKYTPKQVFIVLQNYYDRQTLLKNSSGLLRCLKKKDQLKQGSLQQYQFEPCKIEPEAINWQNIGISFPNYMARALLVFLVLCIFTCLGIIMVFVLQILETASIGDAYFFHQANIAASNVSGSNATEQQTYIEPQSCSGSNCKQVVANYAKLTFLILLTPLTIFACKKMLMGLLSHFVHFRKYPSEISRIKSQIIILTLFYFTVIGALHLFLYLKTQNASGHFSIYEQLHPLIIKMFHITNYQPASIHLYSDFSLDWYKQSTFFLIIVSSTSFNTSNFFKFVVGYVSFRLQKMKALKQKTIYGVQKCLRGVDLHMQNVYASMNVIILFAMLYGCPIPITVIFALINLIILFYITKWTFINYGSRPMRMGHSINRTVVNIIFLGVIIHCIITPIFLGAEGIGKSYSHHAYTQDHPDEPIIPQTTLTIGERYQKLGPYYLTIAVIVGLYILLRKVVIVHVITKIKNWIKNQANISTMSKQKQHFGLYPSYSMHNNKKYSQVLKNIYLMNRKQAKRITCPIPTSLKQFLSFPDLVQNGRNIFKQILEINRTYLDRQKNRKMYEKVEEIARTAGYSQDDNRNELGVQSNQLSAQRTTNERIYLHQGIIDRVIEEQSSQPNSPNKVNENYIDE